MRFDSKAHMAQELMAGKKFEDDRRSVIYYDEQFTNPFRYHLGEMHDTWDDYNKDIWTEIKPQRTPVIGGPFDLCQRTVVEEVKLPSHSSKSDR